MRLVDQSIDPECPVSNLTMPCLNGGSCWNKKCCCPPKFTGKYCEISLVRSMVCLDKDGCNLNSIKNENTNKNADPCVESSCSNKGICISYTNYTGFYCSCFDGIIIVLVSLFVVNTRETRANFIYLFFKQNRLYRQ